MITAMAFILQILAVSVVILVVGIGAYVGDHLRDDGIRPHRQPLAPFRRRRRARRDRLPMWERPSRLV
jgi:hypothetical protein